MIRELALSDLPVVDSFVASYPFSAYRHYRVLPRKRQRAVLMAEITATLEHADGVALHIEAAGGEALVIARTLAWDSAFFGVSMARIEYVLGSRASASDAITAAAAALEARGVAHISARADVEDIALVTMLEAHGFRLMDALVTYTTRPDKEPPNVVREVGTIREMREEDGPELVRIAADAYRGFRGRFHLDPNIPRVKADAFYVEWARQTVAKTMADMVLVAEGASGQLLGFLGFRRREPVSSVGGVPIFGGGLGACRADAPGAYAGLIRAGTVWAHDRRGVAECQTQNYNFPTIRIYEAVGARYVRAEYTLHRFLA